MRRLLTVFALLATLTVTAQYPSSQGKEFYFSFMKNGYRVCNGSSYYESLSCIISAKRACSGIISNPNTGWSSPFAVAANGITTIAIPELQSYSTSSEVVENLGIMVVATDTVSLFIANEATNSFDAANVFPVEALGSKYITQSYTPSPNGLESSSCSANVKSSFVIIATEDSTVVDIIPACVTLLGKPADTVFSVMLNKGQSYQVMSYAKDTMGDLSGSLVEARDCKKIAVFNGNLLTGVPRSEVNGFDHIFEQAVPVVLWGNRFAVTASLWRGGDFCRITALENNTQIKINNIHQAIIQERETYEFFVSDSSCYVETSSPCAVYLYQATNEFDNAVNGDPSMVWITPIEQKVKEMTFGTFTATNTINKHYVNIVTATSEVNYLTLDNNSISQYFNPLSGNPNLSYAGVEITHGTHTIRSYSGFTAFVYGFGDVRGYAYSVGSNAAEGIVEALCMNDTLLFELSTNYEYDTVLWVLGDGTVIGGKNRIAHSYANYGYYTVKAIVERRFQGCKENIYDTVFLSVDVFNRKDTIRETVCMGEHYRKHGFDIFARKDTSDVRFVSGMYGCDSTIVLFLTISDTTPFVFYDTVCRGVSYSKFGFDLPADSLNMLGDKFFKKVFSNQFNCDSTRLLYLFIKPTYLIEDTMVVCQNEDVCCWRNIELTSSVVGTFYVWDSLTTTRHCDSVYKLVFIVYPILKMDAKTNDTLFCRGDTVRFQVVNAALFTNIQWSGPDRFSSSAINPTFEASTEHTGRYIVFADSVSVLNCPVVFDTLTIEVLPAIEIELQDTLLFCDTDTIVSRVANADSWLWNTGDATQNIAVSSSGIYWLEASNKRCVQRDSILAIKIELTDFQIDTTGSICTDNNMQLSVAENARFHYAWNTGDTTSSITVSEEGVYTVSLSMGVCAVFESIEILCPCTLFLPNIFTPVAGIVYLPIVDFSLHTFSMHIYDRWGNTVFKTDRFASWDGTKNGIPVSDGVYYCVVSYTCMESPDKVRITQSSITVMR
jgi:hypothetical protein